MINQQKHTMMVLKLNLKTTTLKSSLCDYSDAYTVVKGNVAVNNTEASGAAASNSNKNVIFKNRSPFTDCISEINNTQKIMLYILIW